MWRPIRNNDDGEPARFKLYISPGLSHVAEAFAASVEILGQRAGVRGLKLGRGLPGLTRPDKLVAYFSRLDDLQEAAAAFTAGWKAARFMASPSRPNCRRTASCLGGLTAPDGAWPAGKLAALDRAQARGAFRDRKRDDVSGAAWRFVLDRLRLDGVNPDIWAPDAEFWRRWTSGHDRRAVHAAEGLLLEPVESLPDTVLTGFEHKSGDFALTRPQSRIHTHIVNDSTAKLLQIFREPVTIADAIIRFSRTEQLIPRQPRRGVPCASDPHRGRDASAIRFTFCVANRIPDWRGELVGDLVVEQPVAVVIDTEVYRARASDGSWAALKSPVQDRKSV